LKENVKTSAKMSLGLQKLKQHKPWFDEECLDFLDLRKQNKIQWLKDPDQSNVEKLNNARCEGRRKKKKKKKEYLNAKIKQLETNSKIKNIRDMYRSINVFKKGYQPKTNTVKGEKGD
jgi:hypothetical protein